ncbi:MAG: transcription termination factor Rho [Planctomycetota bacterium]
MAKATDSTTTPASSEQETEAKPKRRRTTTRRSTSKAAASETGTTSGSKSKDTAEPAEKPKRATASEKKASEPAPPETASSSSSAPGETTPAPASHNGQAGSDSGPPADGEMGLPANRRRKRKKKKRPGAPNQPQHQHSHQSSRYGGSGIPASALPNEEDLRAEAAELDKIAGTKDYAKAAAEALHISELQKMGLDDLHTLASEEGIEEPASKPRQQLIFELLKSRAEAGGLMFGEGTLEIMPEGFGFLRQAECSYLASPDDIYVAPTIIRHMGLRAGMEISGAIRPPKENERFFALLRIDEVNTGDPARVKGLPIFEDLTPLHPEERFILETEQSVLETRVVDLVAPIGKGQRALIVAPPRTGKTVLLQKVTQAISKNYPDTKIIVLLIDERPEEVTDFRRNTVDGVEVVASTFDEDARRHIQVAEMVMAKARRYVEFGQDVVILLDSITRLARAYNAGAPNTGKIMSGGIDSGALTRPKKFFGSARAIENGGSLTILGTALIDTGSKADEVIFEEFKGTGNSELHLDRKLIEKRIFPAIDVAASGTRREELLLDPKELELVYRLRKVLSDMNVVEAMELMRSRLGKTKTNAEFLVTMNLG